MRRVTLVLAAVAMMVSLFAVVAYAAEIQGTEKRDLLTESQRGDTIKGLERGDDICAGPPPSQSLLFCSPGYSEANTSTGRGDRDRAHGNKGNDNINVMDGDGKDIAWGGKGIDRCWYDTANVGDGGDKTFGCEFINGVPQ
jgi:hypothetical protein